MDYSVWGVTNFYEEEKIYTRVYKYIYIYIEKDIWLERELGSERQHWETKISRNVKSRDVSGSLGRFVSTVRSSDERNPTDEP